jgi:hypothetical protein
MTAPNTDPTPSAVAPQGRRVQGTVSGAAFGLGLVILLQQFGVVPITMLVLLLVPAGMALVGLGLGWPRASKNNALTT